MSKAIIYWKHLDTCAIGHGEPIDKDSAIAWVENQNKKWKGIIDHWIEEVPGDSE